MYAINHDALWLIKQESNGSSYCHVAYFLSLYLTFSMKFKKNNNKGYDFVREIMIKTGKMFFTSTSLVHVMSSKWIKVLVGNHINWYSHFIHERFVYDLIYQYQQNNYKCLKKK